MKMSEVELYVCDDCQDVQLEHPGKCPECGGMISCVNFSPSGGCQSKECDYYSHYLYYYNPDVNGPQLEHNAFHLACERCLKAQDEISEWMDEHEGIDPLKDAKGTFLWNKAAKLERRIAA